jgi:serine-type D-Ala-D-Ala carboxypeptidase (penicillin-binding protein 5/6)
LVLALSTLVSAVLVATNGTAVAAPTSTTASTSSAAEPNLCPNKQSPPAAEDDAEKPAPGERAPGPLPVPSDPVGGEQLGKCTFVFPNDAAKPPPSEVNAASWVIADIGSGQVLAAKDAHARQRPAALTKVLLAMVALTDFKPDTPVVVTTEDIEMAKDTAKIGIVPGAKYTVSQLVQAMLMKPGNDVPHALARLLGGVPKALQKMNAQAKQMGALDTRIVTPSGLDGPGMSTSAYDLAVIYRHAMQLQPFIDAQAAKQVTLGGIVIRNNDPLLTSYQGATAGITSNTTDAHWTNLSAATKNGHRLVTVLLRAEGEQYTPYRQAGKLLDYGFALKDGNAHWVGQLVDQAPPTPQPSDSGTKSADTTESTSTMASAEGDALYSAFGNVGMPLTAVAVFFLLAALAMVWRKRRARAARAARVSRMAPTGGS